MKSNIIDALIAFAVFCLLLVGCMSLVLVPNETESETEFTPPSWGVGRESGEMETIAEIETEPPMLESIDTEAVTETEITTETEERIDPGEESLVEVIPPIDGKYLDVPMSAELQDYVRAVSAEYGIPFELTMAVIYVESNFNPGAISDTADYGLMQISSINHGWLASDLGITDFFDAKQSIRAGCHILADKLRKSGGDITNALMRYHDGDGGALENMKNGIFSTQYTDDVLTKYYDYIREG